MSEDKKPFEIVYSDPASIVPETHVNFERTEHGFMITLADGKCIVNAYNFEKTGVIQMNEFINDDGTDLFNFSDSNESRRVGNIRTFQWRFILRPDYLEDSKEKHDCGNQCEEHQDHSWLK